MAQAQRCDESLKTAFRPDPQTRVTAVMAFARGDDLAPGLAQGKAAEDLCMVRLLVGPGNPGPADAPSTSPGIGIELWLPSAKAWTGRTFVMGGGGYSARLGDGDAPAAAAAGRGMVSVITDGGHRPFIGEKFDYGAYADGAWLLAPNGKVSAWQWKAFGNRGIHEAAVKAKALAAFYYGKPARYSYFEGGSNGGRQGMVAAQTYPADFDGIVAGMPAVQWGHFLPSLLQAQIAMRQELGRPIAPDKLALATAAAISACDSPNGSHDGFISDPAACRYDPARDAAVLCAPDGGSNGTPACLTRAEAAVINSIWYGLTLDGKSPDPAVDNGYHAQLSPGQLWFGVQRGGDLTQMVATSKDGQFVPNLLGLTAVAVAFQQPRRGPTTLRNASANGAAEWTDLGYADIVRAQAANARLQQRFGAFSGDKTDLSAFKARGGKILSYHGVSDQIIPTADTDHYYTRVTAAMGGLDKVQAFYRYYHVPGLNHGGPLPDGLPGVSPPPAPPSLAPTQMMDALIAWVEQGKAPERLVVANAAGTMRRPLCLYPQRIVYQGGDKVAETSYACR